MRPEDLGLDMAVAEFAVRDPRPKILVVDDDARDRGAIAETLALTGAVVLEASSAVEGIALARVEAPALILMDLTMPGMTGADAIRVLRADPRTSHTPVIALTNGGSSYAVALLAAGWNDHLQKPVELVSLLAGVARFLRFVRPTRPAIATDEFVT